MAESKRTMYSYLRYTSVGIEMGLSVVAGLLIGQFLDGYFGTDPWLTLVFLIFGSVAGFRSLIRGARRMQRELKESDGTGGNSHREDIR